MYGRAINEDFAPLAPGSKAYNQAKRAREEMLEGFEEIRKNASLRERLKGRKLPRAAQSPAMVIPASIRA